MILAEKLRGTVDLARLKIWRSHANVNVKDLFDKLDV